MECPVCQVEMIVMEFDEIELDYCVECFGVWFDKGEIELLMIKCGLDPDQTPLILNSPEKGVTEANRRCPICGKLMEKVVTPDQKVILDRCKNDHGIWFDAGEVQSAFSTISEDLKHVQDSLSALSSFLGYALSEKANESSHHVQRNDG